MTRIIAHRANLYGPNSAKENSPSAIETALDMGFDVEIDIWSNDGRFALGHDRPTFSFSKQFFEEIMHFSWFHCKNLEALTRFQNEFPNANYFWHESDKFTLTSKGFIWTYPGESMSSKSIAVLPEQKESPNLDFAFGICTDYPVKYKELTSSVIPK